MKKYILISITTMFFIIGCATKSYNTPFINATETVKLDFGMSKQEVLSQMNEPLFVAYGDKDEIIWVYEVRTIEVSSKTLSTGNTIPQKTSSTTKHAEPVHRLALTFKDGQLNSWGEYHEDK